MSEKARIIQKIEENPQLTLPEIARQFGVSYQTLWRRIKKHGIQHDRKQGRPKGERDITLSKSAKNPQK